jgi:hypothetical protein
MMKGKRQMGLDCCQIDKTNPAPVARGGDFWAFHPQKAGGQDDLSAFAVRAYDRLLGSRLAKVIMTSSIPPRLCRRANRYALSSAYPASPRQPAPV